ncbi:Salicylate carboxymethyltransferase [Bienertia sinuspersici]
MLFQDHFMAGFFHPIICILSILHIVCIGYLRNRGQQRKHWHRKDKPPNVLKAYYDQFEKDFSTFLKCRSKEVKAGGMMVLTILGRRSIEPYSEESSYMFDFFATAFNDMVSEGLIEEEKLNTFNVPIYLPSASELSSLVEKEGSFTLNQADTSEVNWEVNEQCKNSYKCFDLNDFSKCVRSVAEPFLVNHFGEAIIEELFERYMEILKVSMIKEKRNVFINVTTWLTRKAQSEEL